MRRLALLLALCAACSSGGYHPNIDPSRFSAHITNPFLPLVPGTTYHYVGTSGETQTKTTVTVTHRSFKINGVPVVVVHDVDATAAGKRIEDTYDYFSQDSDGTVWYMGEDTVSYEDAKPSRHGTWRYGRRGAQPGIAMEAHPKVGDRYRQEYLPKHAEDEAKVIGVAHLQVVTDEFTRLEPGNVERKAYERGKGLVSLRSVKGEHEQAHLVLVTKS